MARPRGNWKVPATSHVPEDIMTHRFSTAALATLSLAALSLPALSASPAMAQDQSTWNGFYIGANIGGTWGDTSMRTTTSPGTSTSPISSVDAAAINGISGGGSSKGGFTGGVEGGYNWVSTPWLFGVETDWEAFDVSEHNDHRTVNSALLISPPITYTINQHVSTDWLWTLRPRVGYVSGPWLVYATGGLAVSDVKHTFDYADNRSPGGLAHLSKSDTKTGWTAGLGGAYAFSPNWSVKGEWLYVDLGNVHGTASTADGFASFDSEAKVRANLLRVGVDYKF